MAIMAHKPPSAPLPSGKLMLLMVVMMVVVVMVMMMKDTAKEFEGNKLVLADNVSEEAAFQIHPGGL